MIKTFERSASERIAGKRLDHYLILSGIGTSRNQVTRMIEHGYVLVNGRPAKPSYKVKTGDQIAARFEVPEPIEVTPQEIPLRVAYEDDDVVVIDKDVDIVVHPARGHAKGTLVNALLHHCKELPVGERGPIRPGVLHRLDKDTTGLLVFAKTDSALTSLGRQVEERKFTREYRAIVWGDVELDVGTVDAPVGRHTLDRKKMAVTPFNSRSAVTDYAVLERFGVATYLKIRLQTGRTHQIRVHMAHIGHPVVGDPDYGGRRRDVIRRQQHVPIFEHVLELIERQALHAARLGFFHPTLKRHVEFQSALPSDIQQVLDYLRQLSGRGGEPDGNVKPARAVRRASGPVRC
jgi:23S rRNA pseudouridine1911/1915/1917 synthase